MSHYDVIIIIIVIIIHYMFVHFLQFRLVYNCNVLIIRVVLLSLSYWVAGLRWDGIDYRVLVLEPIYFLNFSLNNTIELKTCPVYCGITSRQREGNQNANIVQRRFQLLVEQLRG